MSTQLGQLSVTKDILLESGTNELEVLVFRVGQYRLGINVAKVREVLSSQTITQLPKAHASVIGCFRLRESVIPCVSLHRQLNEPMPNSSENNLILAEFNHSQTAFAVDAVERIYRVSWEQIQPVPEVITAVKSPVTAIASLGSGLVMMLDFESIAAEISQEERQDTAVTNPNNVPRGSLQVLIADDSITVRTALETTLRNSGYTRVVSAKHGREAWEWLLERAEQTDDADAIPDLVISDVEMPAMDGLALTRRIREHSLLKNIPVILYSSIATPDNQKKGLSVGADAQITKPDLSRVVGIADELVTKGRQRGASGSSRIAPATSSLPAGSAAATM